MGKVCRRGQEAATLAIRGQGNIIMAMAEGVRALEIEPIHDMRVASRRLRMALNIYEPFLPRKPRKALKKEARRLTGLLGNRREFDVMSEMLQEHQAETRDLWRRFMVHAIAVVNARRAGQAEYCLEAAAQAESDEFGDLLARVLEGVDGRGLCLRKLARRELGSAYDDACTARKQWRKSGDPEDLHKIRVKLKHLRYGCEFHRDLYGSPMDDYLGEVKSAQSLLGDWNECRLLEDMVLTIGNAADYSLAQGAPLVAEAYANRAAELEKAFKPVGKRLFGREGKKAFSKLLKAQMVKCCPKPD